MINPSDCPKCKATMVSGEVVSEAGVSWNEYAEVTDSGFWAKAAARRVARKQGIKGMRCSACGFLELYALEKKKPV